MGDPYHIDWSADLSPALALLGQSIRSHRQETAAAEQAKASNLRSDEYLKLQREAMNRSAERQSHEDARQADLDKRKRAIEDFNARDLLFRQASRPGGEGAANQNPYGYSFEAHNDLPANVEGPELSPTAEAARFMVGAPKAGQQPVQAAAPQPEPDYSRPHMPSPSVETRGAPQPGLVPVQMEPSQHGEGLAGLDQDAAMRNVSAAMDRQVNQPTGGNMDVEGPRPAPLSQPDQSIPTPETAQASQHMLGMQPGPEGKRRVFASYQGKQFELPEQRDTTPFGKDYDSIYQGLIEAGEDPHKAMQYVSAQYKSDQTQQHVADRAVSSFAFRDKNREDTQTFQAGENEKYRNEPTTVAEREKLARIRASATVTAAAPGLKADAANSRDMGVLRQQGAAIRATSQFNKLAQSDKTVRSLFLNIANGSVPLQHGDAQIQLARYFRGTTPTEGEMSLLYHNLGGTADKWNQFKAKIANGDLSPEQLRQLKAAANGVRKEHGEDLDRFVKVSRHMLGPGSGFDNMPDQAQSLYEGMGAELGLEHLPPLFETEGGVTLGSGKRPSPQPRGTKKTELDKIEDYLNSLGGK